MCTVSSGYFQQHSQETNKDQNVCNVKAKLTCSCAQKKQIWNPYFLFLRYWMRTCSQLSSKLCFSLIFMISLSRDTVTAAALKHGYRNMKQWEIVNKAITTNSTSEYPTAEVGGLGSLDLRCIIKISKKRAMERKEVMVYRTQWTVNQYSN